MPAMLALALRFVRRAPRERAVLEERPAAAGSAP
jgi:hypothetical protein